MAAIAKITLPQLYSLRTLSEAGYGSIATLRRAIREGLLDAVRVGGSVKVSAEALDAYMRASTERFAGLRVKMCVRNRGFSRIDL